MTTRETTQLASKRQKLRNAINGMRNVLKVQGGDPNYIYRWVNDVEGRVQQMKELGYEPVVHDVKVGDKRAGDATQAGSVVTKSVGGGTIAVLMRIHKDDWNEIRAIKSEQIDEGERAIKDQLNSLEGAYGKVSLDRK